MTIRRNTPPLTDKVRLGLEQLIAANPATDASRYLRGMLDAHAAREQRRARRQEHNATLRKFAVPNVIRFRGREQSLAAWCRELGIGYSTAHGRLERGYTVEEALRCILKASFRVESIKSDRKPAA